MDSGKRFEHNFGQSLRKIAPGASVDMSRAMRIEDGGKVGKNRQWGDFFFFDEDGTVWLIECKATKEKSFPIVNLRKEQMAALKTFDGWHENFRSVVAINFYGENLRERNDCILVSYHVYENLVRTALEGKRASIPFAWLQEGGKLQAKASGGLWTLDFGGLK